MAEAYCFKCRGEKGDQESTEGHSEEREAGSPRGVPYVRNEGVPDWQELACAACP